MILSNNSNEIQVEQELSYSDNQRSRIRKALLVEDNPTVQMIHKVMLIELGYSVDAVASGEDALLMIENDYDLVLLDIRLPGINGIEVARQFRGKEKHRGTQMLVITTHADKDTVKACLSAGIEQVLLKPVETVELRELLYERE